MLDVFYFFFFFNDTATTEIYTLSLHDALPICFRLSGWPCHDMVARATDARSFGGGIWSLVRGCASRQRSEEHTSELQSRLHLVCRLLLEKKNKIPSPNFHATSWTRMLPYTTMP